MKKIVSLIFFMISVWGDPISALPQYVPHDAAKAALGKMLFFDTRLSSDGSIACVSCHKISNNGADTVALSTGVSEQRAHFNTPTVYNAVFNLIQFWDGRSKDLQRQIRGPLENPLEMNSSFDHVVSVLKHDDKYVKAFDVLYKEGITKESFIDAMVEYEKTLITPNARFDRYLNGVRDILSKEEVKGYGLFISLGCVSCHNGANIGGNMFQKLGIIFPFFTEERDNEYDDRGRYNITHDIKDLYVFRVPSLRNVALTPPYFHDGEIATLNEAVEMMAYYQLGRHIDKSETNAIVAFLKTLTGEKSSMFEGE